MKIRRYIPILRFIQEDKLKQAEELKSATEERDRSVIEEGQVHTLGLKLAAYGEKNHFSEKIDRLLRGNYG